MPALLSPLDRHAEALVSCLLPYAGQLAVSCLADPGLAATGEPAGPPGTPSAVPLQNPKPLPGEGSAGPLATGVELPPTCRN
jgi:hypothetical protein